MDNMDKSTKQKPRLLFICTHNSVHIRSTGLTLATMTALVNTPNKDLPATQTSEILVDARGFTYKSVRFCDLERISDK